VLEWALKLQNNRPSRRTASAWLRCSSWRRIRRVLLPGSAIPGTQVPRRSVPIGWDKRGTEAGTCRKCLQIPALDICTMRYHRLYPCQFLTMQWQISMRLQRLLLNNTPKGTGISVPPNPKTKHDKNKCDHNPERESLTKYQTTHSTWREVTSYNYSPVSSSAPDSLCKLVYNSNFRTKNSPKLLSGSNTKIQSRHCLVLSRNWIPIQAATGLWGWASFLSFEPAHVQPSI
jgi:hypothetical protein